MRRAVVLASLFAALTAAPLAYAQDPDPYAPEDGQIEASAAIGMFIASKSHELYRPTLTHQPLKRPSFDLALRGAYFPIKYLGAELEGALIPGSTAGGQGATLFGLRAQVIGQYPWRLTPFVVAGFGGIWSRSSAEGGLGNDSDGEWHLGLGAKYWVTRMIAARFDARTYISASKDEPGEKSYAAHWELLLGASVAFGHSALPDPDEDLDGVRGAQDKCPTEKGVAPDGCPKKDTDNDGVIDDEDRCPNEMGSEQDGCNPKDTDGDGFLDKVDQCVNEKGIAPDGCPDPDSDKDGVPARRDQCPDVAGIEPDGCPDPDADKDGTNLPADRCPDVAGVPPDGCPDQDADGFADDKDQCADKPETKNGYQDQDGCPDELPKALAKFTGAIRGITFPSGKTDIAPTSFPTLQGAAKVLKEFPELRMEIQGHTDNAGDLETNMKLSQARAEAVKAYLVAQGVTEDRLVARGYGPDVPVGDNKTAAGKAQNRRIEFKLLQ